MPVEAMVTGLGLGMDAMSVAAAIGVKWNGPHQKFRLSWHMGLAQFLMPCIGFAIGHPLANLLSSYGKWAAAVLVGGLGVKMLLEATRSHPGGVVEKAEHAKQKIMHQDPTKGFSLIALSVATSLDALVVGFSLSLRSSSQFTFTHVLYDATIIGLIACLMALLGVIVGQRLGTAFGKWAEIVGALVLILLAVSFLIL